MYYCPECGAEFEKAIRSYETHGFLSPPFEVKYCCPVCKGEAFYEKCTTHCRCCGAKLSASKSEYCSAKCETKGKKLWEREAKRRKLLIANPINKIVRELMFYNKEHGTNYSYGKYVALIKPKEDRKNAGQ